MCDEATDAKKAERDNGSTNGRIEEWVQADVYMIHTRNAILLKTESIGKRPCNFFLDHFIDKAMKATAEATTRLELHVRSAATSAAEQLQTVLLYFHISRASGGLLDET